MSTDKPSPAYQHLREAVDEHSLVDDVTPQIGQAIKDILDELDELRAERKTRRKAQDKPTPPDDVEAFLAEVEGRAGISSRRRLARHAYDHLVAEDLEWLRAQPRTLERERVIAIVESSPATTYDDITRLIAIVREQRDRLARAEFAELALLDLRRAMQSDFEPPNELGAKLLVQSVVEKLDRLAKLEAVALAVATEADARDAEFVSDKLFSRVLREVDCPINRLRDLLAKDDAS